MKDGKWYTVHSKGKNGWYEVKDATGRKKNLRLRSENIVARVPGGLSTASVVAPSGAGDASGKAGPSSKYGPAAKTIKLTQTHVDELKVKKKCEVAELFVEKGVFTRNKAMRKHNAECDWVGHHKGGKPPHNSAVMTAASLISFVKSAECMLGEYSVSSLCDAVKKASGCGVKYEAVKHFFRLVKLEFTTKLVANGMADVIASDSFCVLEDLEIESKDVIAEAMRNGETYTETMRSMEDAVLRKAMMKALEAENIRVAEASPLSPTSRLRANTAGILYVKIGVSSDSGGKRNARFSGGYEDGYVGAVRIMWYTEDLCALVAEENPVLESPVTGCELAHLSEIFLTKALARLLEENQFASSFRLQEDGRPPGGGNMSEHRGFTYVAFKRQQCK